MVPSSLSKGCSSALLVVFAAVVVFWAPVDAAGSAKVKLADGSKLFNVWKETPTPMYFEVFMFNITNVDDILARKEGIKLQVKEVGPYVFRETHKKVNLQWNSNGTVTFANQRHWHFVPEKSAGLLSDKIVSVHPIIASLGAMVNNLGLEALQTLALDAALRSLGNNMFLTENVSSWLFDGITDRLVEITRLFPPKRIDKCGWFYGRNGSASYDGLFTINTGATDPSQLGNVTQWVSSCSSDSRVACAVDKSSTGELWPPGTIEKEYQVLVPDFNAYLTLTKEWYVDEFGSGVQYSSDATTFDKGHQYPHMVSSDHWACSCEEPGTSGCPPSGTLNVTSCLYSGPLLVSLPHMLHADPYYPSKIEGLHPTADMNYRVKIDSNTGLPLAITAQLQYNLQIRHARYLSINNALPDPDTLVPVFWYRQRMDTTPEYAALLRSITKLTPNNKDATMGRTSGTSG